MKCNLLTELMAETINYGGMAATREQAYNHALETLTQRAACRPDEKISKDRIRLAAEMFAFGPRAVAIDAETAARLVPFRSEE